MNHSLSASLAAYIPRDRVAQLLHGRALHPTGVALIADISGFTALTEALAHNLQPGQGAEELTRALTAVFTPLIACVHQFRGSVIKFGGDALIVWFARPPRAHRRTVIRRALTAAAQMQAVMAEYGRLDTPIGPVELRMKVGLAYGRVQRFNLGTAEYGYEDVIGGATLDRMAHAEHQAQPGDIMLDRATVDLLQATDITITDWRQDVAALGRLHAPVTADPWPPLDVDAAGTNPIERLAAYVPAQIQARLHLGQTQVAELKSVVSLFVQFHGLDYDRDPQIGDRLQQYFTLVQQTVARYNGRLNRLITGDKGSLLHILFGAPVAVEEQERRAVRCALDLQAVCADLPFITSQRIGLTVGRVFAGPVGAAVRHDYTVMGDAINLSARLMQHAAPHQILLDAAVAAELGDAFERHDVGRFTVKGKTEPIQAYAAQGIRTVARRKRVVGRQPVFGRESVLSAVRTAVQAVTTTAEGSLITLTGRVGMGKTLLLDTLRADTETAGIRRVRWVSGVTLAYGQTLSGYLFIDLLRDLLHLPADANPADTATAVRHLCQHLFGTPRASTVAPYLAHFMHLPLTTADEAVLAGLTGESIRWRLLEIVPALFRAVARQRPMVISLDDLQWADPTSLQFIAAVLPLVESEPIVCLLAMRPEETPGLAALRRQAAAVNTPARRLDLVPLKTTAARALLAHHAPTLSETIRDHLVQVGDGNPLYLVELARTVIETGAARTDTIDKLELPTSVQGLLLAQLDRLAADARYTLQLAAVIGQTFLQAMLDRLVRAETAVNEQITTLQTAEFIQPVGRRRPSEAHAFRHVFIQEAAYSTLLYERRRAYHRRVAQAIEQLFPLQLGEQAGVLGHHYEQAQEWEAAVAYYGQAADAARLRYAHAEAEALYEKVLGLLETADAADADARRAKTYLKLAQLYAGRLDFAAAQRFYDRAFGLWGMDAGVREPPADARPLRWGILPEHAAVVDPAFVTATETAELSQALFMGLVEVDHNWNLLPAVARRWQVSDDGRTYRFELRSDWQWSDGRSVTAHDFVFAWRRNLNPSLGAPTAYQLYPVVGAEAYHQGKTSDPNAIGVQAVDDLTLEVTLIQSAVYFLYVLATPISFPQPAHQWADRKDAQIAPADAITNGPFQIGRVDENGRVAQLQRRVAHANRHSGNVQTIELVHCQPDLDMFQQNRIDWCRTDNDERFPRRYADQAYKMQGLMSFVIGFSCQQKPVDKAAVRQALIMALDRDRLVKDVWNNVQQAAHGGLIPPGMAGHSPEIDLPFDPAEARRLWESASPKENHLRLVSLPGFQGTPAFLKRSWEEHLGIRVSVDEGMDVGTALEEIKHGRAHVILLGLGLQYPDPDDFFRALAGKQGSLHHLGWWHSEFEALVAQADRTDEYDERLRLYHRADRITVSNEAAVVPLYYLRSYGVVRDTFTLSDTEGGIRTTQIKLSGFSYVHGR